MPRDGAEPVAIGGETISLGNFVKLAGAANSGGGAKALVQAGRVKVNGAVETRRGHKLRVGDVVEVGDERYEVAR
jgi:ribosome-associated protein